MQEVEENVESSEHPEKKVELDTTCPAKAGNMWILDSGCDYDLVSEKTLSPEERRNKKRTNSQKTLNTANGRMIVEEEATLSIPLLGDDVTALVLDNTPSVLSLGKRCMEQGYEFE